MEDIRASIVVERPTSYKENFVEHKLQSNNGKDLDKTKHSTRRSMDNLLRVDTNFGRHFQVLLTSCDEMLHFDKIINTKTNGAEISSQWTMCIQFAYNFFGTFTQLLFYFRSLTYGRKRKVSVCYTGNIKRLCDFYFLFTAH